MEKRLKMCLTLLRGLIVMKVPRIVISVVLVLFLTVGFCFGQNTAEGSFVKGVEYAAEGKFEEAKKAFENALKAGPYYYHRAKEALEVIEDVFDRKIKSKTAIHYFKGKSYREKKQWDEAIAEYNIAIEINPKFAMAYNDRGITYRWKGQHDKAIADFSKAIEIDPKFAVAYYNRGIAHDKKGQYDKEISDYKKAIEINPKYAKAYSNRGVAYGRKGQYDKAISDYNKAIEINPKYAEDYSNRGSVYFVKGQYDMACSDWKRACELGDCSNWGITHKALCIGK